MDYTPISARRVLMAFGLTLVVGLAPVLAIALIHNATFVSALSAPNGYGGLVLGLGGIALAVSLTGLTWLAVAVGRRVVRWPSRA